MQSINYHVQTFWDKNRVNSANLSQECFSEQSEQACKRVNRIIIIYSVL